MEAIGEYAPGMLKIGDTAPPFTLPDPEGKMVTLAQLLQVGPILLYFYPADFTLICTRQACLYRDCTPALKELGIQIVGISRQDPESKVRFADEYKLGFTLLSDVTGTVTKAYGATFLGGIFVRRIAFVIQADGRISDKVESLFSLEKHERLVREMIQRRKA